VKVRPCCPTDMSTLRDSSDTYRRDGRIWKVSSDTQLAIRVPPGPPTCFAAVVHGAASSSSPFAESPDGAETSRQTIGAERGIVQRWTRPP